MSIQNETKLTYTLPFHDVKSLADRRLISFGAGMANSTGIRYLQAVFTRMCLRHIQSGACGCYVLRQGTSKAHLIQGMQW